LEQFGRVSPVLRVHGNRKRKRRAGKRVVRIVASGTASCGVWRSIKWHHQTPQSSGKKEGKPSVYKGKNICTPAHGILVKLREQRRMDLSVL
jgi:hypothetical protein